MELAGVVPMSTLNIPGEKKCGERNATIVRLTVENEEKGELLLVVVVVAVEEENESAQNGRNGDAAAVVVLENDDASQGPDRKKSIEIVAAIAGSEVATVPVTATRIAAGGIRSPKRRPRITSKRRSEKGNAAEVERGTIKFCRTNFLLFKGLRTSRNLFFRFARRDRKRSRRSRSRSPRDRDRKSKRDRDRRDRGDRGDDDRVKLIPVEQIKVEEEEDDSYSNGPPLAEMSEENSADAYGEYDNSRYDDYGDGDGDGDNDNDNGDSNNASYYSGYNAAATPVTYPGMLEPFEIKQEPVDEEEASP